MEISIAVIIRSASSAAALTLVGGFGRALLPIWSGTEHNYYFSSSMYSAERVGASLFCARESL